MDISALRDSRLAGDLLHLISRQFGIKCLSLLAVSYAMRRLGPEGLGQAGLTLAVVSVVSLFSQLGIEILLPKYVAAAPMVSGKAEVAARLYSLRVTLLFLISPVFVIGAIWQGHTAENVVDGFGLISIWVAGFCYMISTGLNPQAWSQGIDEVKQLANRQFISSVITAIVFLVCFYWCANPALFIFVQTLGLLLVVKQVFTDHNLLGRIKLRFSQVETLVVHTREAWPLMVNSLVVYCFGGLEGLMVAALCSREQIGFFNAAGTLSNGVNAFLALVPLALYPRLIDWARCSQKLAIRRVSFIALVILLSAPGVYLLAKVVCNFGVPIILGDKFARSGPVLAALIVQYIAYIGYYGITSLLVLLEKPKTAMTVSLIGAAVAFPAYLYAARTTGAVGVAHAKMGIYLGMVIVGLCFLAKAIRAVPKTDLAELSV